MIALHRVGAADLSALEAFLRESDLTVSGLDSSTVTLFVARDDAGQVWASTGFESSADGSDVLVRSVAVRADRRGSGVGTELAQHALYSAARAGARRAWPFSRRSGPFWESLGFSPADRRELAAVLSDTHQVRHFRATGQLEREVTWSRPL